jgi:hypothetical protein
MRAKGRMVIVVEGGVVQSVMTDFPGTLNTDKR